MPCPDDKERLSAYVDGELRENERQEVERHLTQCAECRREVDELRSWVALATSLPRAKAPPSVAAGVARERSTSGKVWILERYRRPLQWAVAAAAVMLIIGNVFFFSHQQTSETVSVGPSPGLSLAPREKDLDKLEKPKEHESITNHLKEAEKPAGSPSESPQRVSEPEIVFWTCASSNIPETRRRLDQAVESIGVLSKAYDEKGSYLTVEVPEERFEALSLELGKYGVVGDGAVDLTALSTEVKTKQGRGFAPQMTGAGVPLKELADAEDEAKGREEKGERSLREADAPVLERTLQEYSSKRRRIVIRLIEKK